MPNNANKFDHIVVGGGVIGASIFYHLANEGYKVCLLEKSQTGSGCTSLSGGIVRVFHLNSELSDKAAFSWNYYVNFKKNTGIDCAFHKTGFVYFPNDNDVDFSIKEIKRLTPHVQMEWLDSSLLDKKFGHLLTTVHSGAVYEPNSGYMDPLKVTLAWLHAGQLKGGIVYENAELQNIQICSDEVLELKTTAGCFSADNAVLALGPYTPMMLDKLGLSHDLYTQAIQVDIRKPTNFNANHPAFIDDRYNLNGRPNPKNNDMYIGYPTYLRIQSPDSLFEKDLGHSQMIHKQGVKRWNWVKDSVWVNSLRSADCYREGGVGFVRPIGESGSLYVATGYSGGGFKMAPWVGNEILRLTKQKF